MPEPFWVDSGSGGRIGWSIAPSAVGLWLGGPALPSSPDVPDAVWPLAWDGAGAPGVDDPHPGETDDYHDEEWVSTDGFGHTVVACGDISGDGLPDVAIARAPAIDTWGRPPHEAWDGVGEWGVSFAPDFGVPTFLPGTPTAARGTPCGDLDGNGVADLCVDSGVWYGPIPPGVPVEPGWAVSVGDLVQASTWPSVDALLGVDLDADGVGGLLLATGGAVWHLEPVPLGAVDIATVATRVRDVDGPVAGLAIGDLDHDGAPDLVAGLVDGSLTVGPVAGGASWLTLPGPVIDLAVGDVDGDGDDDLVVGGGSLLSLWRGPLAPGPVPLESDAERWHGPQYPDDDLGRAVELVDSDADGLLEIAVTAPQFALYVDDAYYDDWNGLEPIGHLWLVRP